MVERIVISEAWQQMKGVTSEVNGALRRLGAKDGVCLVFVPYTTAGMVAGT